MSRKPAPPARHAFEFAHRLRVRWGETDPQGIVFNPNYLVYADVALTEFWRSSGIDYANMARSLGVDTFMVNANADYFGSAVFDDELDIGLRVERLGRSSMSYLFCVFRGEESLVAGALTYVFATVGAERKPMPIPDEARTLLARSN